MGSTRTVLSSRPPRLSAASLSRGGRGTSSADRDRMVRVVMIFGEDYYEDSDVVMRAEIKNPGGIIYAARILQPHRQLHILFGSQGVGLLVQPFLRGDVPRLHSGPVVRRDWFAVPRQNPMAGDHGRRKWLLAGKFLVLK